MVDEDEAFGEDEPESGMFRWMSVIVVLLAVAGFFGLAWYAYENGREAVDEKDVELVKADKTPVKEAPANPGGMQIPNQDKTVYHLISGDTEKEKPVVERILPAPEEPIARPAETETWMSESAKHKTDGESDEKPDITQQTAENETKADDSGAPPKEQFNPSKIRNAKGTEPKEVAISPHVSIAETSPEPVNTTSAPPKPDADAAAKVKPVVTKNVGSPDSDTDTDEDTKPAPKPAPKESKKPAAKETKADTAGTAKPASGARVQLGSYRSQAEAESNWKKISHKFSDELQSKQHYIAKVTLGSKGTYYRLQVAPFDSSRDAEQFCIDFVSSGQGCILAKGK